MTIPSLVATALDGLRTPSQDYTLPSDAIRPDPTTTLTLIKQAELKIQDLQQWRDHIHADAVELLSRIRNERATSNAEIVRLKLEVALLRERSAEAEFAVRLALADKENAEMLGAAAAARAIAAEQKALDAEMRSRHAEEWLAKLQDVMVSEFASNPPDLFRSDHATS